MFDISGLYPLSNVLYFTFDKGYKPETSYIFLLHGPGNFLVLFLIHFATIPS